MACSRSDATCVKLYLCSNPEDSVVERRALRERVFPKLREHCRLSLGLDFRVIDPFESSEPRRWPDERSRHQLIEECRETSAGAFLLALVGHQYGRASLPERVEVSEFEMLLQQSQRSGVSTKDLERLYHRDQNCVPASFSLRRPLGPGRRPQSQISQEEQKQTEAKEEEEEEEDAMKVFQASVNLCVQHGLMSPERALRYYRSALDADLRFALNPRSDDDIIRRCLVYVHKVLHADRERKKGQMSHTQSESSTSDITTAYTEGHLLSDLCDHFLPGLGTSCQHLVYTTSTQCDPRCGYTPSRRQTFADSLCQQVYSDLLQLADSLTTVKRSDRHQQVDAGALTEQQELCDALSQLYDVIRPEEEQIRAYVQQSDQQRPLVVVGGPCAGKTVLLAHCAHQIRPWLPDADPVVITYFCSLDPLFSPSHLFSSLCFRMKTRYHGDSLCCSSDPDNPADASDPRDRSEDSVSPTSSLDPLRQPKATLDVSDEKRHPYPQYYSGFSLSELKKLLSSLLSLLTSPKQPLVLILDGLDQIQHHDFLQILQSLPSPLPPGLKLILTVSSSSSQVLQAIAQHYPQSRSGSDRSQTEWGFVCVRMRAVDRRECLKLLVSLLRGSGRKVTSGQQVLVNQALTSCPLTLYTRLLHVHTSLWSSDSDVTESSLPGGIHDSVSMFLDHLEHKHGSSLVARAVSLLTLSRSGLTEVELVDLLSVDETVPSGYGHHSPNAGPLPETDVEKLLLDLRGFLIRRTFLGSCVLLWVNQCFKTAAAEKYLRAQGARREIHLKMADYFSGGDNPPSQRGDRVNLRKAVELPYHLEQSGRWEELERGVMMSPQFHQTMVRGGLLQILVSMLQDDKSEFVFFRERQLLAGILTSAAHLLQHEPLQLSTVMESNLLPYVEVFPALGGYLTENRGNRGNGFSVLVSPAPSSVPPIQRLDSGAKTVDVCVAEVAVMEVGVVAEVTDDGSAWIWKSSSRDVAKMTLRESLKFVGVKSCGGFLLLSTQCGKIFLWDTTGAEKLIEVKGVLKQNPGLKTANELAGCVECQKMIFMWWKDESFVSVFNLSDETLTSFQCPTVVTCVICSSNGLYVFCGQDDGTISVLDSCCLIGSGANSNHTALMSIILSDDEQEVACVDRTGNVSLWDVSTKTVAPRLVKERFTGGESHDILSLDHAKEICLLLVCQCHQVTLWDSHNWEIWDRFCSPQGKPFTHAVLSQCGHLFLAVLETCGLVLAWEVSKGECVLSLETHEPPHSLLKTASDVICVGHDSSLTVWDTAMIDAAGSAPKTGRGVKEVVVEEIGGHFYTTDGSETVWKWSFEAGFPQENFQHDAPVEKLRLSSDNLHLVALSAEEIYVWKTETGQNILRIDGSRATDVLITPNNKCGVSVSERGLSRVWTLTRGSIVCDVRLNLSDAKVSPESTFLIGCHDGDLLAVSLWSGYISRRFSSVERSERVVSFHMLSEHPDFVLVMAASGAVYTWNIPEETACKHFLLPSTFHRQLQDVKMSSDGHYALLSTDNGAVKLLDLSLGRIRSFKAKGPVIIASVDRRGRLAAYVSLENICVSDPRARPVLTVVRLADGQQVASVCLSKNPLSLTLQQWCVFVGFQDGSVAVYSVSDVIVDRKESVRSAGHVAEEFRTCPFDRATIRHLHLANPNIIWP